MPALTPLAVFRHVCGHPWMPTAGLVALAEALRADDPALIEDQTTLPLVWTGPKRQVKDDPPCEGTCLVAYPLWKGLGLTTAAEVEDAFNELMMQVNRELAAPQYARPSALLIDWWDDPCISRSRKRRSCLALVEREIERRKGAMHA